MTSCLKNIVNAVSEDFGGLVLFAMMAGSYSMLLVVLWSLCVSESDGWEQCDEIVPNMFKALLFLLGLNVLQSQILRCVLCYSGNTQGPEPRRVILARWVL